MTNDDWLIIKQQSNTNKIILKNTFQYNIEKGSIISLDLDMVFLLSETFMQKRYIQTNKRHFMYLTNPKNKVFGAIFNVKSLQQIIEINEKRGFITVNKTVANKIIPGMMVFVIPTMEIIIDSVGKGIEVSGCRFRLGKEGFLSVS